MRPYLVRLIAVAVLLIALTAVARIGSTGVQAGELFVGTWSVTSTTAPS